MNMIEVISPLFLYITDNNRYRYRIYILQCIEVKEGLSFFTFEEIDSVRIYIYQLTSMLIVLSRMVEQKKEFVNIIIM